MTEPRILTPEERAELTRQFFASDFYKLIFKPERDAQVEKVHALTRMASINNNRDAVFAWRWYMNAIEDIEQSWIGVQQAADKLPDLEPASYGAPKYPKVKGEE
jgi:hypothetical protein